MSRRKEVIAKIKELGVIAVVRADSEEKVRKIVSAVVNGGIKGIEITFTVPNALKLIEETGKEYGDEILLGAGTVLAPADAASAIASGARFVVSPVVNRDIVQICNNEDVATVPGAMTPTEVVTAWQSGADCVKLFPAEFLGPRFIKALKAPFPDVELMPTGGVNVDNLAEWFDAGACAVAVGSALVDRKAVAEGNFGRIQKLAEKFLTVLEDYRAGQ